MRLHKLVLTPIAVALMACAIPAVAQTLTFQGVTFTAASSAPNFLTIEIDAAGRTGDWAAAVSMDSIDVKNIGTYSSASLLGPGGAWTYSPLELSANSCDGGASGGACFTHAPVALSDNMIFNFTFTGGPLSLDVPTLKVRFLDANGEKVGSLLSQAVTTPVPEPETYAMLLAGLGLLGFAARRRKQKQAA